MKRLTRAMNYKLPKLQLPKLSRIKNLNLVFSTSRRFNLFKDTVESLIHHNPDINDLIENVYILDDRSSYEDRNKMEDLISQNFPHKGRLVTFNNSSYPYAYVEKLNFIQKISHLTLNI